MKIHIEKHLEEQGADSADGFFAGGIANSAIAGKCGNGGIIGRATGTTSDDIADALSSREEILKARAAA